MLWKKIYSKGPVLALDIFFIPLAWYMAFCLRYNLELMPAALLQSHVFFTLGLLMLVQGGCYYHFKIYRGLWRFSSMSDVVRIVRAVGSACVLVMPILYSVSWLHHIPRSVWPLYVVLLIAFLCSGRLLRRYFFDRQQMIERINSNAPRVLIVGAGQAGEMLVRELKRTYQYIPLGFVDDHVLKSGHEVHGVRVLGCVADLPHLVQRYDIELIFIAIPSATSTDMRRILSYCETSHIPTRTLPGLSDIVAGRVAVNALRHVNIDDLLGREQIYIQEDKVGLCLAGQCVVVTGGGGSIGSELCRQIAGFKPSLLVVVDHHEFNLYSIERTLSLHCPDVRVELALLNVTDQKAICSLFNTHRPDVVFHAAAYKHVPLLESQIRMAVRNNVIGTQIVAQASVDAGVGKFILISTDKAVNPTNVMGTTKRVAEIFCQNLNARTQTQFITVRFGNVLGSVGSVVPLFQQQLQEGGPLTVTHPDMERYFMTIPEACLLILQAMANGTGGEIFVLDMGAPVKIKYLAEQMIRLAGKEPGKDIEIKYVGLRPGEKLFEELFHEAEALSATEHPKLFKAHTRSLAWGELTCGMHMLHEACMQHEDAEFLNILKNLVPEFQHALCADVVV